MNRALACFANFICADQHFGRAYWTIAACILAGGIMGD